MGICHFLCWWRNDVFYINKIHHHFVQKVQSCWVIFVCVCVSIQAELQGPGGIESRGYFLYRVCLRQVVTGSKSCTLNNRNYKVLFALLATKWKTVLRIWIKKVTSQITYVRSFTYGEFFFKLWLDSVREYAAETPPASVQRHGPAAQRLSDPDACHCPLTLLYIDVWNYTINTN